MTSPRLVACCDDRHTSPFCPTCGKKLRERETVDEILCHFSGEIKKRKSSIRNITQQMKRPGEHEDLKITLKRKKTSLEKYERWREALRELKAKAESR
jgi:hypothetical protein